MRLTLFVLRALHVFVHFGYGDQHVVVKTEDDPTEYKMRR